MSEQPGISDDELLDQMPSKWKIVSVGGSYPHGYVALFRDTTNHCQPLDHSDFLNGIGPTRHDAIANAVAKARRKERGNDATDRGILSHDDSDDRSREHP